MKQKDLSHVEDSQQQRQAEALTTDGARKITLHRLLASVLTGNWPKVALVIFVVELAILFVGSTLPIPQSAVASINNQDSSLRQSANTLSLLGRAVFLFSNNFHIAALQFVPLLGWYTFASAMYNTALAIEVIGITSHLPGPIVTLSLLFEPHTWLELPAYALATTQSFYLISSVTNKSRIKFELLRTPLVFAIVAIELIVAALFESSEITLESSSILLALALPWVAFAVLIGLLYAGRAEVLKHSRKDSITRYSYVPQYFSPDATSSSQSTLNAPTAAGSIIYPIRFCSRCGAKIELPGAAFFCDQCGEKL
jgi:uncharacterized membrane protein SpoIIM required for sporulation